MAFFDELGKKITQTGQDAAKKAKDLADITKLNSQLGDLGKQLHACYGKLGERYFELHRADPQDELAPLCGEADAVLEKIAATRQELQRLKNIKVCPSCGVENPTSAAFCSKCSAKLPDIPASDGKLHCVICGGVLTEGAAFCTQCGNKVES